MARFDAATAVEALEWDFSAFNAGSGVVPEPSTARINTFFNSYRVLAREVQDLRSGVEQAEGLDPEDMSEEELSKTFDQVDESSAQAINFQQRSMEAIAHLCGAEWVGSGEVNEDSTPKQVLEGGSPSLEQLEALPYRVLQEFTKWLMDEIRPKTSRNQPASRPSRKGKRRTGSSRAGTSN